MTPKMPVLGLDPRMETGFRKRWLSEKMAFGKDLGYDPIQLNWIIAWVSPLKEPFLATTYSRVRDSGDASGHSDHIIRFGHVGRRWRRSAVCPKRACPRSSRVRRRFFANRRSHGNS